MFPKKKWQGHTLPTIWVALPVMMMLMMLKTFFGFWVYLLLRYLTVHCATVLRMSGRQWWRLDLLHSSLPAYLVCYYQSTAS